MKYTIHETIQKIDGTKVYCIDEKEGEIFGMPVYKEVFRGSKEECEKQLRQLRGE